LHGEGKLQEGGEGDLDEEREAHEGDLDEERGVHGKGELLHGRR